MKKKHPRKFLRLRAELTALDIDPEYLASLLGVENRYYTDRRLRGEYPWDMDEMYRIMDILRWPYDRMHELFPKEGQDPEVKLIREVLA